MDWTTPDDLIGQIARVWDRGVLLSAQLLDERLFPLPLRLKRPSSRELAGRFDQVRAWIAGLESSSRERRGFGYEISWEEIVHRQLGRNKVPKSISVPSETDALRLIGKEKEAKLFRSLARVTLEAFPSLRGWILRKPLTLLKHAEEWEQVLAVLAWFQKNPQSGLYLRQIDIPGIGTKYIEARKALFSELLDAVLPHAGEAIPMLGRSFEQRYGLVSKPALVHFRILDRRLAISGLTDLTVPVEQFAALSISTTKVFITENEINGLTFPPVESGLVIFALGYGVELLRSVTWLLNCDVTYWGDIDTHGFAMLGRLRAFLPAARSMLMDEQTLLAHQPFWGREDAPFGGAPEGLTPEERRLFEDLRSNRFGGRVRLEQERVGYRWLEEFLSGRIGGDASKRSCHARRQHIS
jgi:hypothetical protein